MAETFVPLKPDRAVLLSQEDGPAVEVINRAGQSNIVFVCEHASCRVPVRMSNLGLSDTNLAAHIGWDPGARDLAVQLSAQFDAPLVAARFSRLVYDCNRPPDAQSAMPFQTEVCEVPANRNIDAIEKQARVSEIYEPFHAQLVAVLEAMRQRGQMPILVTVHSFTPVFHGVPRSVEVGLLTREEDGLAQAMLRQPALRAAYQTELNAPYAPVDGVLHTIEKHLAVAPMPYVMLEVRNDLLTDPKSAAEIFENVARSLRAGCAEIGRPLNKG